MYEEVTAAASTLGCPAMVPGQNKKCSHNGFYGSQEALGLNQPISFNVSVDVTPVKNQTLNCQEVCR